MALKKLHFDGFTYNYCNNNLCNFLGIREMRSGLRVLDDCKLLVNKVINLTDKNTKFNYTLNPQLLRSCISIGSNLVEGRRRTNKEFCRFLDISIGSADEALFQISFYNNTKDIEELLNRIIGQLVNLKKYVITHNPSP